MKIKLEPVSYPATMSASEMARAIQQGQLSSVEVVQACIDRIETVNKELNAVVQLRVEDALKEAAYADSLLSQDTKPGPLLGVPFTIKDSFDTRDLISTAGTAGRKKFIPKDDATVVRRLREAGGILLAKTNTPELTLSGETDNLVYGRTNNPYDLNRTCGGSSGGSAAIVAAFGSPLDIGSDTGGSVRLPAHFSGVQGFKPSSGRVSRAGHIISYLGELQYVTTPGPLARTVEDLILAIRIISGEDDIDPHLVNRPFTGIDGVDVSKLRVAYYTDNTVATPTTEIVQTVKNAVGVFESSNAAVTEILPAKLTTAHQLLMEITLSDISWVKNILEESGTNDSPLPESLTEFSTTLNARPQARQIEEWHNYRSWMLRFMQDFDVIICPVAPVTAPVHGGYNFEKDFTYTSVFTFRGMPAASIRAGISSDNLPINIQIVGMPWADGMILSVARFLEKELSISSPFIS